jgi:hypothetical protein
MVLIDETGCIVKQTEKGTTGVKKTTTMNRELEEILKKYEDRFHGVGKAKRDGKDIEIHGHPYE